MIHLPTNALVRFGRVLLMGALFFFGELPEASATLITLQGNNLTDNSFTFTVVPLAAVSDVANISGTIVVDIEKTGSDITSITFVSADLGLDDLSILQDVNYFGAFPGTLGVTFTNTRFSIVGGPFAVSGGSFDPTGLEFEFFQGTLDIAINSDITGAVGTSVDYSTDPATVTFGFSSREGFVTCDNGVVSLFLPMDVASPQVSIEGLNIFLAINASLDGVAIPEASSSAMLALTTGALGMISLSRLRKSAR
jgi:hypothetical protein